MTSINTNSASLNAQRALASTQNASATAMQRLSSGLRLNAAKDDAAGLAISERMSAQARGMSTAMRNANDAISMLQVADGALGSVMSSMQRMRELAVQSANGTNNDSDRVNLQKEFNQLQQQISKTLWTTEFNNKPLLTIASGSIDFQVSANTTGNITYNSPLLQGGTAYNAAWMMGDINGGGNINDSEVIATMLTSDPDFGKGIAIGGIAPGGAGTNTMVAVSDIRNAIEVIDTAMSRISNQRSYVGATINRLDAVLSNLRTGVETESAARGRIVDTDYAQETASLARTKVLQDAGTAMVAQANQLPQQVLSLLKG